MMIEMQFNSIAQLQRLQEIASSCDDETLPALLRRQRPRG